MRVVSADGTPIQAYRFGDGDPVVIVGGAFSTAEAGVDLATSLAGAGYAGWTYDRRARAGSGDTAPYAPERESEDLAAVIAATDGPAAVLGHSSGAVLAYFAAGEGVAVRHLFLSEPPFNFADDPSAFALADRLQAMVDAGQDGEAVTTFQIEGVGLPAEMVEQIRQTPDFAKLLPLAQSVVYDATLTAASPRPSKKMLAVTSPITILIGEGTFPIIARACELLDEILPAAELVRVPESGHHAIDAPATTRVIAARLA
ncbi:alpha/beta hydrolase fold protein [Acidipropionibacterium acidipropionici ATCC 4875]|uniref:Alpha/beta hydrolase fold protein n=1 Tax=Acidipropionibacterium acidipropionici (strain ATCC 4875 / DSM 20272 / JCM 6432 / NBRC 12425 / NCIMB 8070 / 4) TaxID=1171373 RepID=K7S150_ACIA4|nr:alpha/beta hydrolase fold protein [Acidipropionibacterium acidipropionici ATCC 4875]